MDEENVLSTDSGLLVSLKRKGILTPATARLNPEDSVLNELSQPLKENAG